MCLGSCVYCTTFFSIEECRQETHFSQRTLEMGHPDLGSNMGNVREIISILVGRH
jgi:hypothetical protein